MSQDRGWFKTVKVAPTPFLNGEEHCQPPTSHKTTKKYNKLRGGIMIVLISECIKKTKPFQDH